MWSLGALPGARTAVEIDIRWLLEQPPFTGPLFPRRTGWASHSGIGEGPPEAPTRCIRAGRPFVCFVRGWPARALPMKLRT